MRKIPDAKENKSIKTLIFIVFMSITKFVFIPNGFAKTKAENLAHYLQTEYLMTPVANTRLLGILMVLNNHGILLPNTSSPDEIANLRKCTG